MCVLQNNLLWLQVLIDNINITETIFTTTSNKVVNVNSSGVTDTTAPSGNVIASSFTNQVANSSTNQNQA